MPVGLKVELTAEAAALLREAKSWPDKLPPALAKAMDGANQFALANIVQGHLTGQGPFPVQDHKLGVRSSRLRGSVRASKTQVFGDRIESAIGSNVKYAAIHEFGGYMYHPPRSGSVRLRTDRSGNLLSGSKGGAVFAKRSHKRAKQVQYKSQAWYVEMPERAPIRTGLEESSGEYTRQLSGAVLNVFGGRA